MQSQFARCRTGRGSIAGLFLVRPTKVNASKSFLFNEGTVYYFQKLNANQINYLSSLVLQLLIWGPSLRQIQKYKYKSHPNILKWIT